MPKILSHNTECLDWYREQLSEYNQPRAKKIEEAPKEESKTPLPPQPETNLDDYTNA